MSAFLSGLGHALQSYGLGDRLALAQAYFSGDPSQVTALRARQEEQDIQRQALALRQQAAQRAEEDSQNQVWGMKASGHFDNPSIAAMNPDDRSHAMAGFVAPYDQAPGVRRVFPGAAGQPDRVVTAPTTDAQNAAFYESQQPGAGAAYVNRQAYGPPVPIQQGGGLAVNGPNGYQWGVAPEGVAAPRPSGPPASAPRLNATGTARFPDPTAFRGGVMTSGRRTPQGNAAVGGVRNSSHLRGDGADFTPLPGQTLQQTLAQAQQYFGPNARVAIHNGTHVHATLPGYGQTPYFGARGAAGAPRQAVRVASPQQALGLSPGTRYSTPDGREFVR